MSNPKYLSDLPITPYGRFLNPQGYKAPWHHNIKQMLIFTKAIFEFTSDPNAPITFEDSNYNQWRTNNHFFTDWGSIPIILQPIIPKDIYLGYLFHDSGYGEHGLWIKKCGKNNFEFKELTIKEVNELLYQMMMSQNAWKITATTVYDTLQVVGRFAWNNAQEKRKTFVL
jgi:hypothetical protein